MKQNAEELAVLKIFMRLYKDFPNGQIYKSECPDFILELTKRKIGIEITEVFQDSNNGPSKLQAKSSDQSAFVDGLIKTIQPNIPFTFHLSIHFNIFHSVKRQKREALYITLAPLCISALKLLSDKQNISINDFRLLPKEISKIHLSRYDGLVKSFNEQLEGGGISNLSNEHIATILSKKDESLKKYQPCDEFWLLIKEGNYYAGHFDEILLQDPIISDFTKVFLVRSSKLELVQLK